MFSGAQVMGHDVGSHQLGVTWLYIIIIRGAKKLHGSKVVLEYCLKYINIQLGGTTPKASSKWNNRRSTAYVKFAVKRFLRELHTRPKKVLNNVIKKRSEVDEEET